MEIRNIFLFTERLKTSFRIFLLILLFSVNVTGQNKYTVTSTDDTEDIDLADNTCADSNGNCTLRAAIQNANKNSLRDKIDFNISGTGPYTIYLKKNLPAIKETVELNATGICNYAIGNPQIVLDGRAIVGDYNKSSEHASQGFRLTDESAGSTIKGFNIIGFSGIGISVLTDKNTIQSNIIGITVDGKKGFPTSFGIIIKGSDNLIGGNDYAAKNVFSGTGVGIFISTSNTRIIGNYIGTTADGCSSMGNRGGIALNRYSEYNYISDNLVSGNDEGIQLVGDNNTIINNRIGTNAAGTEKIPNRIGIHIIDAVTNVIGVRNNGNLISGNKIGISVEKKYVVDQHNKISDNLIGTDISGNFALGNETGILLKSGNDNWIGGFEESDGNLISGNTNFGIEINGSRETIIAGNYIGTNKTGTTAIPNGCGIKLEGDHEDNNNLNNRIIANLISGNSGNGIEINNAELNSVTGNMIGTQKDSILPLPNGGQGIRMGPLAQNNCIGGPEIDQQNTLKFNRQDELQPLVLTATVND